MICQDTPNRSTSHPHRLSAPPFFRSSDQSLSLADAEKAGLLIEGDKEVVETFATLFPLPVKAEMQNLRSSAD